MLNYLRQSPFRTFYGHLLYRRLVRLPIRFPFRATRGSHAGGLQGCEAYRRNVIIGSNFVVMSAITTTRCTVDHQKPLKRSWKECATKGHNLVNSGSQIPLHVQM
jgi:hypothetical protein